MAAPTTASSLPSSEPPSPPDHLILSTNGQCDLQPECLVEVFGHQRQRFVSVLRRLRPEDWTASTRCAEWSAHDVVRHLCDANAIAMGTDNRTLDVTSAFDPRTTPRAWLMASVGESPGATMDRFVSTTEELLGVSRNRLARRQSFDVRLPYGPMDWTVLLLHAFWDSWIHERDVLFAQGRPHQSDDQATFYVTAYGVFIAAAVAAMFGDPTRATLMVGGNGGGLFDLDSQDGEVTLTASRGAAAGPVAAEMTDALAGRSPVATQLAELPSNTRKALSRLAVFFNTPPEETPA